MIEPLQSDDAFLQDIESARAERDVLHVWWLGQSGFLVRYNDLGVLFDPYLSDALTTKYADTPTPHVRMSRRVIDPARLGGIDYVTATHGHTDHLDGDTLNPLLSSNPTACFVYPRAIQPLVDQRVHVHPRKRVGTNAGEWVEGVLAAVPAAHDRLDTDAAGNCKYLGFIATLGPFKVYHAGDGVVYDGMTKTLRRHELDVAILPINGQLGNMNGTDAAQLASAIEARLAVPCHYDMFAFNTADPAEQFIPECERRNQPHRILQVGERLTLGKA